jgi:hypothetical protein
MTYRNRASVTPELQQLLAKTDEVYAAINKLLSQQSYDLEELKKLHAESNDLSRALDAVVAERKASNG